MRFVGLSMLALGVVCLSAFSKPAAANIVYGSNEQAAKWAWSNQAASNPPTGGLDWGSVLGQNYTRFADVASLSMKSGSIFASTVPTKELLRRTPEEQASRVPITHQQLMSFHGSVADLVRGDDRPVGASPGIFVNYVPDTAGLSDKGGGTTVPLPPAFWMAAIGLGLVYVSRRLGWCCGAGPA